MDHQKFMLPRSRVVPSPIYISTIPQTNLPEPMEDSVSTTPIIYQYENKPTKPIAYRNFIELPENETSPYTITENDQYYQPSFKPNVQPTKKKVDTNNLKSIRSRQSLNKSLVMKIVLITIVCFLGLCIVPVAIAVPIILTTRTTASIVSITYDVPTGTILLYTGNSSSLPQPTGRWLLCDGSAVNRITYRDLFAVISITFGLGNGVDTFNLPDFRNRFPLGSNGSSLSTGGASTHNLTVGQLPAHTHSQGSLAADPSGAHTHSITDPGHNHGGSTGSSPYSYLYFTAGGFSYMTYSTVGSFTTSDHTHSISTGYTSISVQSDGSHSHTVTGTTSSVGLGDPIDMMPPYQIVHYIIRT